MQSSTWSQVKFCFSLSVAVLVIALALALCIYPALTIVRVLLDPELKTTGHSRFVPAWFEATAGRHLAWAERYLVSDMAETVNHTEVAATEWPMFGSVFFLVTAQQLHEEGKVDATHGVIREAVEKSAEIVASPKTATWVRTKCLWTWTPAPSLSSTARWHRSSGLVPRTPWGA